MKIGKAIKPVEPININRRVGKFKISYSYIVGGAADLDILFNKVYVIRAENDLAHAWIEYTALSPHFDELTEGESAPDYIPTITKTPMLVSLEWDRINAIIENTHAFKDGMPMI